ncbi:hypothetical protein DE146DRAFT_772710 [Phaeosphaeria sp. MPI-PUGE-AT-0046c]|nr:hypothetical protein DE146DRAFT_772710 [Phaeosphaeria sp. MPI-PUGE-AT-0046c]
MSSPPLVALEVANLVKAVLERRDRPLAHVTGFTDIGGHTSVAATEWEHLELRGKAINALRVLHKVALSKAEARILYLNSKLAGVPDKPSSWVYFRDLNGKERRHRRHNVEIELAQCKDNLEPMQTAFKNVCADLTLIKSTLNGKLSDMCSAVVAVFPSELRQMVYADLGHFVREKDLFVRDTEFKDRWTALGNKPSFLGDWRFYPAVVGDMAYELVEIMHRKNKFVVTSDAIVPHLLNNTSSLHKVMMKHVITNIQVDLREIDSGVESNSKAVILFNLHALLQLKCRHVTIMININYGDWFSVLPAGLRDNRLHTAGMNMYGKEDRNVLYNKSVRKAIVATLPLLKQLIQQGQFITLKDRDSRWVMELSEAMTIDEIWDSRLKRRRYLHYNNFKLDLAMEEMYWKDQPFNDVTPYDD